MQKGHIKTFKEDRGFGFITPDHGGKDVFFHQRAVQDMGYAVEVGAPVEFDTRPGKKPGELEASRVVIKGFAEEAPPAASKGPSGTPKASEPSARPAAALPPDCVFVSFYDDNGLSQGIFFGAPEKAAGAFRRAGLKSTQFRQLFQGYQAIAGPLQAKRISFATACERFGAFYCERVVRQASRGWLPPVVKELIDAHREAALKDSREMLALFTYLKNIYCYFGDSDKK